MGKLAQVAMAAGLAALGCSSSTVNDSGATGGAGSGGAAGASGASSGGAGGSSTGGGSAGQDASSSGGDDLRKAGQLLHPELGKDHRCRLRPAPELPTRRAVRYRHRRVSDGLSDRAGRGPGGQLRNRVGLVQMTAHPFSGIDLPMSTLLPSGQSARKQPRSASVTRSGRARPGDGRSAVRAFSVRQSAAFRARGWCPLCARPLPRPDRLCLCGLGGEA